MDSGIVRIVELKSDDDNVAIIETNGRTLVFGVAENKRDLYQTHTLSVFEHGHPDEPFFDLDLFIPIPEKTKPIFHTMMEAICTGEVNIPNAKNRREIRKEWLYNFDAIISYHCQIDKSKMGVNH